MNNLKELTKENHTNAERQAFVKALFKGELEPELYATYLWNQFPMYEVIEMFALRLGLLDDFPELMRSKMIMKDFQELWPHEQRPKVCNVTKKYIDYVKSIMDDEDRVMAHIYVRHMGDLSGGQMLAKRVPGSANMYKFEGDLDALKDKIRAKCHDGMADEAKVCFDFATELFQELMEND